MVKGTPAARDPFDYFAGGVAAYFDAAGTDRPTRTREAFKAYDPDLHALVEETMAYRGHQDWRFKR